MSALYLGITTQACRGGCRSPTRPHTQVTQPQEPVEVAATQPRAQSPVVQEPKMQTHAEGQASATSNKCPTLDWPSPERLMVAQRGTMTKADDAAPRRAGRATRRA